MPHHFIRFLFIKAEENLAFLDSEIRLTKNDLQKPYIHTCTVRELIDNHSNIGLEERDLCLVDVPRMQPRIDRIKNFFLDKDCVKHKRNIQFEMSLCGSKKHVAGVSTAIDAVLPVTSDKTGYYEVRKYYKYTASSKPGDCGSLLIVKDNSIAIRKIAGLHIAAHGEYNEAYSTPVTQEMLTEALKCFARGYIQEDMPEFVTPQGGFDPSLSQFNVIGKIVDAPHQPTHTSIRPSPLHNTYLPAMEQPASLKPFYRDGQYYDPMILGLRNYCANYVSVDRDSVTKCVDSFLEYIQHNSKIDFPKRLFTIRESVDGIEDEPDFRGMSSSTSSGFPMNTRLEPDIYAQYFKSRNAASPDVDEHFSVIESRIIALEEKIKSGTRPWIIATDCLKDQRLSHEKVAIGKNRVFSASTKDLCSLMRMYFGSFCVWITKNRISNGIAIGVNPYSDEWHLIALKLKQFNHSNIAPSPSVLAGDFKHFDADEQSYVLWAILDGINSWYNDEHSTMRERLWMELVNSRHVCNGWLLEWAFSLPSGIFLTIYANCIYNHIAHRYSWIKCGLPIEEFNDHTYLIVNGDDSLCHVHPAFHTQYNAFTLPQAMETIGLTYTTEDKSVATSPFRHLHEVEFNKRSFVFDQFNNRYIAPLRLSVVLEIPMWSKKGSLYYSNVASNVITSLRELSLHPREIYGKWSEAIISAFELHCPELTTTEPLRRKWQLRRAVTLKTLEFYC
jgi:hypothetical protein